MTAARKLADSICGRHLPLLMLHDFDSAGIIIRDTSKRTPAAIGTHSAPTVIDLGLRYTTSTDFPPNQTIHGSAMSD